MDAAATIPPSKVEDSRALPNSATASVLYRNLQPFRKGGLGELFRAEDESLFRIAVLKFMNEACEADPKMVKQFRWEAEVTGRLDHPGVVPVYGIGEDWSKRTFYAMRLIDGQELKQAIRDYHAPPGEGVVKRNDRETLNALLDHLRSACNTVAYAHHVAIIHCDLKPSNIMIGQFGETYVLDWGLAANFKRSETIAACNGPTMRPGDGSNSSTATGSRGGTIEYMSPEQFEGDESIGPSSDVFSLGATLYEILTGATPYSSRDPKFPEKLRTASFPRPQSIRRDLCPRLEAICLKAMHRYPASRYESPLKLAEDLANWMRDDEVAAAPDNRYQRFARSVRRHLALTLATFVSLVTVIIAASVIYGLASSAAYEKRRVEADRAYGERLEIAERVSLNGALKAFEHQCEPFANGQLYNLSALTPFIDTILDFSNDYLKAFQNDSSMSEHTQRVYALRATVREYSTQVKNDATSLTDAISDLQKAELLTDSIKGLDSNERDRRLARILLAGGRLLSREKQHDKALEKLDSAVSTLQKLTPMDDVTRRELAEVQHGMGEVYYSRRNGNGDLRLAVRSFDASRNTSEDLPEIDTNRNRFIARSYGWLGDVYLAQRDMHSAFAAYNKSRQLRYAVYKADPSNVENRLQCARGLGNFGYLELGYGSRGDYDETTIHKWIEESEQIQSELVKENPNYLTFRVELANTQAMLAELYLLAAGTGSSQHDKARDVTSRAKTNCEFAAKDDEGKRCLARVLVLLACLDADARPDASKEFAQSAEKTLAAIGEGKFDPRDLATLAMALSLQGREKLEQAFTNLQKAADRGENTFYRYQQHKRFAFKAMAEDDNFGKQLEALIAKLKPEGL
jgi:serine/threonine-protein kinase